MTGKIHKINAILFIKNFIFSKYITYYSAELRNMQRILMKFASAIAHRAYG